MSWGLILDAGRALGWPPSETWAASFWELTEALASLIAERAPKEEGLSDDDIWAGFSVIAKSHPLKTSQPTAPAVAPGAATDA